MKDYFQSHTISKIIAVLAGLLLILLIFQAGVLVGYRRGQFASNWTAAYGPGMMGEPRSIFAPFMHDGDDVNPHSSIGEVVSVKLPSIMIKGANSAEQIVTVSPTTTIRYMHTNASTSDLVPGSQVLVIGEPEDNGSIDAVLIRIMPMPPRGQSGTTTLPLPTP